MVSPLKRGVTRFVPSCHVIKTRVPGGIIGAHDCLEISTGADPGFGEAELARYDVLSADPVLSALQGQVVSACEELGFERFVAWVLWPAYGVRRSTYVSNYSPD